MPGRFEYKKLNKYPHLSPIDAAVWERFISLHPLRFDRVDYDVHVGEGITPAPQWEPQIMFMAMWLSQCRIDVIGWNGENPTIIELKGRAMTEAVGQLVSYQALYRVTYSLPRNIPLLLICEDIPTDILTVCSNHNIEVIIV
jgi:hypothetical protein